MAVMRLAAVVVSVVGFLMAACAAGQRPIERLDVFISTQEDTKVAVLDQVYSKCLEWIPDSYKTSHTVVMSKIAIVQQPEYNQSQMTLMSSQGNVHSRYARIYIQATHWREPELYYQPPKDLHSTIAPKEHCTFGKALDSAEFEISFYRVPAGMPTLLVRTYFCVSSVEDPPTAPQVQTVAPRGKPILITLRGHDAENFLLRNARIELSTENMTQGQLFAYRCPESVHDQTNLLIPRLDGPSQYFAPTGRFQVCYQSYSSPSGRVRRAFDRFHYRFVERDPETMEPISWANKSRPMLQEVTIKVASPLSARGIQAAGNVAHSIPVVLSAFNSDPDPAYLSFFKILSLPPFGTLIDTRTGIKIKQTPYLLVVDPVKNGTLVHSHQHYTASLQYNPTAPNAFHDPQATMLPPNFCNSSIAAPLAFEYCAFEHSPFAKDQCTPATASLHVIVSRAQAKSPLELVAAPLHQSGDENAPMDLRNGVYTSPLEPTLYHISAPQPDGNKFPAAVRITLLTTLLGPASPDLTKFYFRANLSQRVSFPPFTASVSAIRNHTLRTIVRVGAALNDALASSSPSLVACLEQGCPSTQAVWLVGPPQALNGVLKTLQVAGLSYGPATATLQLALFDVVADRLGGHLGMQTWTAKPAGSISKLVRVCVDGEANGGCLISTEPHHQTGAFGKLLWYNQLAVLAVASCALLGFARYAKQQCARPKATSAQPDQ